VKLSHEASLTTKPETLCASSAFSAVVLLFIPGSSFVYVKTTAETQRTQRRRGEFLRKNKDSKDLRKTLWSSSLRYLRIPNIEEVD